MYDMDLDERMYRTLLMVEAKDPEKFAVTAAHAYNQLLDYKLEGVTFEEYLALMLTNPKLPLSAADEGKRQAMNEAARRVFND